MSDLGKCPACGGKFELLDPSDFPGYVPVVGCFHCQKTKGQLERENEAFLAKIKTIGIITTHAKPPKDELPKAKSPLPDLPCPACGEPLSEHSTKVIGMGVISYSGKKATRHDEEKATRHDDEISFVT